MPRIQMCQLLTVQGIKTIAQAIKLMKSMTKPDFFERQVLK